MGMANRDAFGVAIGDEDSGEKRARRDCHKAIRVIYWGTLRGWSIYRQSPIRLSYKGWMATKRMNTKN